MTDTEHEKFIVAWNAEHFEPRNPHEQNMRNHAWWGWHTRAALDGWAVSQDEREKLAEALFYRAGGQGTFRWETEPDFNKGYWRKLADTAIAALRQPQPYREGVSLSATYRWECQWWRDDALENAALIAERYPTDGKNIAGDIRAMIRTQPQPDTGERDLALIDHCSNFDRDTLMHNSKYVLSDFNAQQKAKR